MKTISIIQLGAIAEIRIPAERLSKFKRERSKDLFIRKCLIDFLDNGLKQVGIFDVYSTNGLHAGYDGEDLCEIPDFNYSATNQVKQNKEKNTFRFFNVDIFSIGQRHISDKDKFIATKIIKYKNNEFKLMISSFKESSNKNID